MFFQEYPYFCNGSFYDKNHNLKGRISEDGKTVIKYGCGYNIGRVRNNKLYDSYGNHVGDFKNNHLYDLGGGIRGGYSHDTSIIEIILGNGVVVILLVILYKVIESLFF